MPSWPILKPVSDAYTGYRGEITLRHLHDMARDYDPSVDHAAVKLDHVHAGAAHGWVSRLYLTPWQGETWLWAQVDDLSDELRQGIESKRWRRVSAEVDMTHPETGRPYLTGLATLGAGSPAIKGQPDLTLSAGADRRLRFITDLEGHAMADDPNAAPAKTEAAPEAPASPTTAATPPLVIQLGALPPIADTSRATPVETAQDSDVLELHDRRILDLQRRYARLEVRSALDSEALRHRVTPAQRRVLEPLLVHLAAQPTPMVVQYTQEVPAADGAASGQAVTLEEPIVQLLLKIFELAPEIETLASDLMATVDGPPAEEVQKAEMAALAVAGIDKERALQLSARYGEG
ncbi:MAG: hypothetical protein AAGN46_08230 [Acidobacteriota bacterium]